VTQLLTKCRGFDFDLLKQILAMPKSGAWRERFAAQQVGVTVGATKAR